MSQTLTPPQTNDPVTYPSRIYNDGTGAFEPNTNMSESSDNITTVLTDKNEVLGFKDGTSQQEMLHAIDADRNGSISEYKPSFYEKYIREPLAKLGMSSFQPTFISDIKPSPERAFATSMARAATADIFKPEFSEQEAKAYPAQAFAGSLVGSVAAFATGGALLDGLKLTELTPFAENIIKGGILGGAYKGISETSNELRDSEHPDLAKIGMDVLHDSLWWGGISGLAGAASKPVGVAASAGLGYLMAKSDGADEPTALLNGAVLGGFHLLNSHPEQEDVRQLVVKNIQSNVADYILEKNPLVHPIVADQAGREFFTNHVQDAIEKSNEELVGKTQSVEDVKKGLGSLVDIINNKENISEELQASKPKKPFTDGYDPKMMDYLSKYIPPRLIVRMTGTDRLALANESEETLNNYKEMHRQIAEEDFKRKEESKHPSNPDVERMENEGGYARTIDEVSKSPVLLKKVLQNITKQVKEIGDSKIAEPQTVEQAKEVLKQQEQKLSPAPEGKGISKIAKSINAKAIEEKLTTGFDKLAGYDKITVKDQAEKAVKLISDLDKARRVIRGEEPLPEGLRGTALVTAMEEHLKNNPNPDIAYELANSPLVSETSIAAQELRLAAERTPDSATSKLIELKRKLLENKGGEKELSKSKKSIVKSAKTEMEKINLSKEEMNWDKFLDDIKC